jgi:hypothetical protein
VGPISLDIGNSNKILTRGQTEPINIGQMARLAQRKGALSGGPSERFLDEASVL